MELRKFTAFYSLTLILCCALWFAIKHITGREDIVFMFIPSIIIGFVILKHFKKIK